MKQKILDFNALPEEEQEWFTNETWCSTCSKADLGIVKPQYYSENGKNYIEGECKMCGSTTRSQLLATEIDESEFPE